MKLSPFDSRYVLGSVLLLTMSGCAPVYSLDELRERSLRITWESLPGEADALSKSARLSVWFSPPIEGEECGAVDSSLQAEVNGVPLEVRPAFIKPLGEGACQINTIQLEVPDVTQLAGAPDATFRLTDHSGSATVRVPNFLVARGFAWHERTERP